MDLSYGFAQLSFISSYMNLSKLESRSKFSTRCQDGT